MPIDFERIPPKVQVPLGPRPSAIVFISSLCLALCFGITTTVLGWNEGSPTSSAWFWLCAVGYPILGCGFVLVSGLAYGHIARKSALAQNQVSEEAEQACHDAASQPLVIGGYGWHFSSDRKENGLQSILDESVNSKLRQSAAFPGSEVHARWIEVPGEPFYAGNELGEHTRHVAVCKWLIERLLDDISTPLETVPASTVLQVHLCPHARFNPDLLAEQLRCALEERHATINFRIDHEEHLSIFETDDWLDRRDEKTVHLVIAIQLRDAISAMLGDGAAEAGVALLMGDPRLFKQGKAGGLHLHRPVRGARIKAAEAIGLASRWGKTNAENLEAVWIQGLSTDELAGVRAHANLDAALHWRQLEASVGDCSDAGGWLAVALAAASTESSENPQLVLCAQGDELVALVCRKEM